MKHFFKQALIASTILYSSYNSFAQIKEDYQTKIDRLIQVTDPRSFNGVVFIQQNGKIKYEKAYGYADYNKKSVLKISDKFSTMSIAKQITATLVLQEVEKGTIDLQIPIRKYLPDCKYSWADTITVHHLLNNTSGLSSDDIEKPLKFVPGTAFNYSNMGYYVAGQVLEKQSGKSFQQLVTALFKKCKMTNSYYPNKITSKFLTKGHSIKKDGSFKLNEQLNFDASNYFGSHLIVSAPDLAKWNACLHAGKLLKPATYKMMTTYSITNTHQLFSKTPIGYGYGLRINDKDSIMEIGHTGYHPSEGFTAVNLYYPKTKTSVIVIENQANENFENAYYFQKEIRKIIRESKLLE
ncbi:serine hydrolase domain-containing protein [Flavobacterium sp. Fl-77]|uniref:Serine hydrolase domain-containing protein n=1 Tax=Flavobacterium flavipigmentatum TaxID=2893884 RepID=A0AAJ2SEI8_9FLAO|nr:MULTISPECIES: serine hydrolase domain-containing protein [unclassified Flavobacterium]MDX6182532.1 serine hydrolase domain-containing protein [Flavobacterium sp. Fl-33]MDX6185555.1 serine hydrolase domain-containing protein [Flavobacterium sp. Fl-77]UFH38745.1 beta-lactamase family protein [Flavobacterium sp. F-70]